MIKPPGIFFITLRLNFGKFFLFSDEKKGPLVYTFNFIGGEMLPDSEKDRPKIDEENDPGETSFLPISLARAHLPLGLCGLYPPGNPVSVAASFRGQGPHSFHRCSLHLNLRRVRDRSGHHRHREELFLCRAADYHRAFSGGRPGDHHLFHGLFCDDGAGNLL